MLIKEKSTGLILSVTGPSKAKLLKIRLLVDLFELGNRAAKIY
jgi:hypothetical protein